MVDDSALNIFFIKYVLTTYLIKIDVFALHVIKITVRMIVFTVFNVLYNNMINRTQNILKINITYLLNKIFVNK